MTEFLSGLQLNEAFYWEAVRPILDRQFPGLPHSAALIGFGSDVIGFDTPVSRDHMWGPRPLLFLADESLGPAIHEALRQHLPAKFRGYSVHFGAPDETDGGTRVTTEYSGGPVEHMVETFSIAGFWQRELGVEPSGALRPVDWLTFQEHRLLSLTSGKVFHDDLGLESVRAHFAYYPEAIWRYMLAAQWTLISQEEAFVGRTDSVGDTVGSRIITARLVERIMRLCFLMERRYTPYSKWFGTAFQRLACAGHITPLLEGALAAGTFTERDRWLAKLYTAAGEMHNALGLTPPLDTRTRTYSGWHLLRGGVADVALDDPRNTRPFQTIFATRFADALVETIQDPEVLRLLPNVGSVNQYMVESSDALQNVRFCRAQAQHLLQKTPESG